MTDLRIVKGNDFRTAIEVHAYDVRGQEIPNFDLEQANVQSVIVRSSVVKYSLTFSVSENNILICNWPAIMACGTYNLEVSGLYNGSRWRFVNESCLSIVATNKQANIPESSILDDDFYQIEGRIGPIEVHADWEAQEGEVGYIENRPDLSIYAKKDDVDAALKDYIEQKGRLPMFINISEDSSITIIDDFPPEGTTISENPKFHKTQKKFYVTATSYSPYPHSVYYSKWEGNENVLDWTYYNGINGFAKDGFYQYSAYTYYILNNGNYFYKVANDGNISFLQEQITTNAKARPIILPINAVIDTAPAKVWDYETVGTLVYSTLSNRVYNLKGQSYYNRWTALDVNGIYYYDNTMYNNGANNTTTENVWLCLVGTTKLYKNGVEYDLANLNQQSDWEQSDSTAKAFIKNKPDLSIYATLSQLATKQSSGSGLVFHQIIDNTELTDSGTTTSTPDSIVYSSRDMKFFGKVGNLYYSTFPGSAGYRDPNGLPHPNVMYWLDNKPYMLNVLADGEIHPLLTDSNEGVVESMISAFLSNLLFVGTQAQYDELSAAEKASKIAFIIEQ